MDMIIAKILAVILTLSQVTTRPEDVKTQFRDFGDRAEVIALLQAGCAHIRKVFEVEELQLDDLVTTAMSDPQSVASDKPAFRGIKINDLFAAYRQFCKNETVENSPIDIAQVIDFYNKSAADLPDHTRLKGLKLAGPTVILDAKGDRFTEMFEGGNRRIWTPLGDIPDFVQKAFVAAEDKRFFQHHGIDERGLVRAFVSNLAHPGRPQGGSTITQQVVKNLLVGDDVTYERKIREIIVASRLERTLSKQEILELYLNSIYLGRNSWGIEMAARSYFGKSAGDLSLAEAALLAAMTKGPNFFNPERAPERARERLAYVVGRMQEDGIISAQKMKQVQSALPPVIPYERSRNEAASYFSDYLARELKAVSGIEPLTNVSYRVHATINPDLQRATEAALQEGLARYELNTGRVDFQGPELNLAEAIKQLRDDANTQPSEPGWQRALRNARAPLPDVQWQLALVVEKPSPKSGTYRVGLSDGRILPLRTNNANALRRLQLYDVIYVRVGDNRGRNTITAELRVRPVVQGAALILENKTGRVLAMAGGFSHALSQLNRTSQTRRQPGSAFKPFSYLAALHKGLQPNTLLRDEPITLPPIGDGYVREQDYWSPKNYDGSSSGITTLRRALENSRNLATVSLLDGGIESEPSRSLDRVCELTKEAQIYSECFRFYPIVLGAQPVRLIDLAAFYAAIANEGARPTPHAIESVELADRTVYRDDRTSITWLASGDRVAFYQLKSMLQGVVQRGTANAMAPLARYVAGKTGTSDEENDAWFVGFSNDVTIAVWVGYDNANGRRTLGRGQTGGKVAVPIFESIIRAVWDAGFPRVALNPPSSEARRQLVSLPINLHTGERLSGNGPGAFYEQFRLDPDGQIDDTQYNIVSQMEATALRDDDGQYGEDTFTRGFFLFGNGPLTPVPYGRVIPEGPIQSDRGIFGNLPSIFGGQPRARQYDVPEAPPRLRRIDPNYRWKNPQFF